MEKLKPLVSGESMSMYFGGCNKKNYGFSVRILSRVCVCVWDIFYDFLWSRRSKNRKVVAL
jgi:hypothetical protein